MNHHQRDAHGRTADGLPFAFFLFFTHSLVSSSHCDEGHDGGGGRGEEVIDGGGSMSGGDACDDMAAMCDVCDVGGIRG